MRIIPGYALAVVKNDKTVFSRCTGYANLMTRELITPATNFRLASLTKPFTAQAIMLLAKQKKLSYQDNLKRYFPRFPKWAEKITIESLLNHSSGLPDYEQLLYTKISKQKFANQQDAINTLEKEKRLLFQPNTQQLYGESGYMLLAKIIELVSSKSYNQFLTENIFIPLKMEQTAVAEDKDTPIANCALGYRSTNRNYLEYDTDSLNFILGNEGVYSSINDLPSWVQSWYTNKLLPENMIRKSLTPKNNFLRSFSWKIDSYSDAKVISHGGRWVGFRNMILCFPEKKVAAILLTNSTDYDSESKRLFIILDAIEQLKML